MRVEASVILASTEGITGRIIGLNKWHQLVPIVETLEDVTEDQRNIGK